MVIEQQNQELLIRVSRPIDIRSAQKVVDYFNLMESISKNKGTEEEASSLAREVHKDWWSANRNLFLK